MISHKLRPSGSKESGETMTANPGYSPPAPLGRRNTLILTGSLLILLLRATQVFGLATLSMAAVSILFAAAVEFSFARVRGHKVHESSIITPLVFTLLLPPATPLWMVAVGSGFGVFFGKAVFGGYGRNVFNPAVTGRLFLTFAFPQYMLTRWLDPVSQDIVSSATPLITLNRNIAFPYSTTNLLLGQVPGTLGETFRLGIIVLGLLIVLLKIADWRIPASFIGTVFLMNAVGTMLGSDRFRDPMLSLLVGGLLFGAFFVATDPVSAPYTSAGKLLFGLGLGFITVIIRNFGTHNEGVIFAVIIMNALAPQLDKLFTKPTSQEVQP